MERSRIQSTLTEAKESRIAKKENSKEFKEYTQTHLLQFFHHAAHETRFQLLRLSTFQGIKFQFRGIATNTTRKT